MKNIASKVRERRRQRQISQQQTAQLAGVALNVVKAIEAGRQNVKFSSLQKVLDLFGLTLKLDEHQ